MRLSGTKTGSANQYNGLGDQLYDLGGARPTLDLNFASNGSLVDSVTGKTLVTHTRASNATYVDGDGIIKDAVTNLIWPSEDFNSSPWVKAGVSVTADAVDNPYGEQTADTLTATATAFARVAQNKTINSNTFVFSTYAKAGTAPHLAGTIELKPSLNEVLRIFANLSTGATNQITANGTISATSGSEQLANGWWRFYWIITTPTTGSYDVFWAVSDQETGFGVAVGKTLHLWGTQLEEASTLGEYVKTTSTINSAPRFDHKVTRTTTNLLTYSEELDQSVWSKSNASITPNVVTTPNNTFTGDKLVENTANSTHYARQSVSVVNGTTYTASFYIKAGERSEIYSDLSGTVSGALVVYNASTDTFVSVGSGVSSHSSESVGNGWYRVKYTVTSQNTQSGFLQFYLYVDGTLTYTGDGTSGLYLWGAQLEQNSDVGPYVKTEASIATKVDAEPLGLLVEESRTNLLPYSEDITDADWTIFGTATRSANTTIAPDGTTTADTITLPVGSGIYDSRLVSANTTYTFSVYIKGTPGTSLRILINPNVSGFVYKTINVTDNWVRYDVTHTTGASDTAASFQFDTGGGGTFYVWGMQAEAGSFPTSYIRTAGSTVTRSADVTSIEGNDFGTFNLVNYSEHLNEPYAPPNGWGTSAGLTRTPNAAIAPDGTKTATRLTQPGGSGPQFFQRVNTLPAGTYTLSVYAKAVSGSVNFALNAWNPSDGAQIGPLITATTEWQRFTHTFTTTVTDSFIYPFVGVATTVAGDIDFWGAQLEQSSTATPYVKSDVTWTSRASNATYYDYTGTLKKSSYNLLTYSEGFNNVAWVKNGTASVATGFEAPDGSLTALKATYTDRTYASIATNPGLGTLGSGYRRSVWAKVASGTAQAHILGRHDASNSLVTITDQWQRFELTITDGTFVDYFFLVDFRGSTTPDVDFYFWGAQLETGTYAGDYAKTEGSAASSARNVAFLPDGSGNFVSAGELLLEDAGTNIITYSEDVSQSLNVSGPTVTLNQGTAPDGTNTANKISGLSTTNHYVARVGIPANTYTFSFWIKAVGNNTGTWGINYFDGSHNRTAVPVTTEWVRHSVSFTSGATTNIYFADNRESLGTLSEALIWGLQIEESPYATSYIPTYGSSATRAADVSSSSSNTFGNSFYNQTEGSIYVQSTNFGNPSDTTLFCLDDGTTGQQNQIDTRLSAGIDYRVRVRSNAVSVSDIDPGPSFALGDSVKLAQVYKVNDYAASQNGLTAVTDTSGAMPLTSQTNLKLNKRGSGNTVGHTCFERITFWPTRLSNDTLKTITT